MLPLILALSAPFGHDHYITRDGAWCWFADPRAIWVEHKILSGVVAANGGIKTILYDPKTKKSEESTLAKGFEKDDHANPSFQRLPDGRILAFFSKHTGPDLWQSETKDGRVWSEPRNINPNDPGYKGPANSLNAYCYPNPQLLSQEKNRLYLFWRGMNWKPTMAISNDLGKTWSAGKIIVSPTDQNPRNRPYVKVSGDGKSRIHIAFTDGHPRDEATNSIYYLRYEKGAFRDVRGEKIANLNQLPIRPDHADVVYDGKAERVRSWIWDVAEDAKGNPVITYTRLRSETEHDYRYAFWNGKRWVDRPIVFGGQWFPQTEEGKKESEPHYSGGLVLDHSDPRFVYLSRPINGRFEIERWLTNDGGDTWSHVAITGESKHDSVRPYVVRGDRPQGVGPTALWMNLNKYVHYTNYQGTIQAADEGRGPWPADKPLEAAEAVWRWVRSNPSPYTKTEWMLAPLYSGLMDYADVRNNDDPRALLRAVGKEIAWKMGPRASMADDVAVGQGFLQLYELDKDPAQLSPVQAWMDHFVAMPHTRPLEWKEGVHNEEMAWCDALFMAPPTLAMLSRITGDPKYAYRMAELWRKTSDYLYDPTEQLYFRDSRYFGQKEANGKKVFWSRGNGWVIAGLARVLQNLPKGFSQRPFLENQFKEMATRIAELQTKDGTWHASLLDPVSYAQPETSGTSFYVYALAWGVNAGLLERSRFEPAIQRGFASLCSLLDPNGRLMYVQPIGQDPRVVRPSDTDTYGVGGFLMAACQVSRMRELSPIRSMFGPDKG